MEYIRSELYSDLQVSKFMVIFLFEDMCTVVNDAIRSAGTMETEFTFVVKNVDGSYRITEIDYRDE